MTRMLSGETMPTPLGNTMRVDQSLPDNEGGFISGHLVGILTADLVGYSELINRDLHNAIDLLRVTRRVITNTIISNGGRVVQTPGDFVLALFPAVNSLLMAAYEAQLQLFQLHSKNNDFSAGHWKIGLAYGEVFSIDDDFYGNSINVAARLQALAAPGEVLFTEEVSRLSRLPNAARLRKIGKLKLKNISEDPNVLKIDVPQYTERLGAYKRDKKAPVLLLDNVRKPVLLIRNFRHIGNEERGQFLGEALVDEISLILSRLSGSIVVASDIGKNIPDYILHGSMQSVGEKLRITAQLTAASDGKAIWVDRIDGHFDQSFDFQDQIARDIVSALQLVLTEGEQAQLWRRATISGKAWEAFQRGHDLARRYTRESHRIARTYYQEAIDLDPTYLSAIVGLGFWHLDELRLGWSTNQENSIGEAMKFYSDAKSIATDHPDVLALGAYVQYFSGDSDLAKKLMQTAKKLAPESAEIVAFEGALYDLIGDFETAVVSYKKAISKSPFTPAWIASNLALTLLAMDENAEAEHIFKQVIKNHPEYARAWIGLPIALIRQNKADEARKCAATLLELDPLFTVDEWAISRPFSDQALLEKFKSDFREAGLL